ncbi:hypothetical protein DJ010_12940 [Nocardioides silvaticus]|uniref:Uncharacterized protein n=1 Tax=Nocardioides silvaticus TaxID=2201891 RepID=A0A316TST2_9ACTN|nr:hypothetical protein [Nocardioides silvaticus]PWN02606.1 hypothetical protein DJ010_12940 [Nocardioides silvaticus]
MGITKNKVVLLASAGMLTVGLGTTGAVAADMIGSGKIIDDSIRSVDLKDGGVKYRDLHPSVTNKIENLQQQVADLEARVADLENSSTTAEWVPNEGATIVDDTTVSLTIEEGGATSIETQDLNVPVQAGDEISFDIALEDGATCTAGAPRMFVEIGGTFVNSYDDQTGCAGDSAPPSTENGTVTFTVPENGRIGQAGFVYDNGIAGTVTITNVTIDGNPVEFQ